jgi:hypothetical protein
VEAWCWQWLGFVDEAQSAGKRQRQGSQASAKDQIYGVRLRGGRGVAVIDGGAWRSHVAGGRGDEDSGVVGGANMGMENVAREGGFRCAASLAVSWSNVFGLPWQKREGLFRHNCIFRHLLEML